MTWAAIIRAVSLIALIAMFVTDKGFGLWNEPPTDTVYLGILALALGVDADWLRRKVLGLLSLDERKDRP